MSLHDALMERAGWPAIPYDGKLLVSHQDALLIGGKVQAPPGTPTTSSSSTRSSARRAARKLCIEICSGAGHHAGREAACRPSTARSASTAAPASGTAPSRVQDERPRTNIDFRAGAGGLHSAEN